MHDTTWIWAVVGGLAIAGVLLFHILNGIVSALPPDVRAPIAASAKANSRPLAVLAVVVLWTATYGLYSVAHLTGPAASLASAGGAPASGAPGQVTAPGTGAAPVTGGAAKGVPGAKTPVTIAGGPAVVGGTSTSAGTSNPTTANSVVFGPHAGSAGPSSKAFHDSTLFKGAANLRGINSNTVVVCGH